MSPRATLLIFAALAGSAHAQHFHVTPYLQRATPTAITIMWETHEGAESVVEWGPARALGQQTAGDAAPHAGGMLHTVRLVDLQPDTPYFYRVRSGAAVSPIARFRTPPRLDAEQSFRLVAMSDMQIDRGAPAVFSEIVSQGIIRYLADQIGGELSDALAMTLVPGDLVENGNRIEQWRGDFFAAGAPLFDQVPLYPVSGNHENDAAFFFSYFDLPRNGTAPYDEHWWFADYSNLRVIGLDTNRDYRIDEQLDWLDGVLAEACAEDRIDFVFAQLHHPHLSELWPVGELDYTGEIIARLETFSTECVKPSLHFFGHTHGYSRGQSRDHRHLWVNVASAGGNLDRWGEYAQNDYDEFVVSQDEYGFVLVEVDAGEAPEFRLTRVSRGRPGNPLDNVVRDRIRIRRFEDAPAAPQPRFPAPGQAVSPDCVELAASPLVDPDDDPHQASHWQVSRRCNDFEAPAVDRWRQDRNWFDDEDTQAGADLTTTRLEGLAAETAWCWRVRYRDDSLEWSEWSDPSEFITGPSQRSPNLVRNPGAEDGLAEWEQAEGISESLPANDCQGIEPAAGARYFIVGGLCESSAYAELTQRIDVAAFADLIMAGNANAVFGAMMADFNGSDEPQMYLRFIDAEENPIETSETVGRAAPGWASVRASVVMPANTRWIDVVLTGTRNAGQDNDSYIDDVFVQIGPGGDQCSVAPPVEPEADMGVADMGTADMGSVDMDGADMGMADARDMNPADALTPTSDMLIVDMRPADARDMRLSDALPSDALLSDALLSDALLSDARPADAQPGDLAGASNDGCSARPNRLDSDPWWLLAVFLIRRRRS